MSSEKGGPSVYDETYTPDVYDIAEKVVAKYTHLMERKIFNQVTNEHTSLKDMGHIEADPMEVQEFANYLQEVTDEMELQGLMVNDFSQGIMFGIYITASRIGQGDIEAMLNGEDDDDGFGEMQ